MAVVDFAPIVQRDAAVDALLDARRELAAVQFSTLPGLPLYEAMRQAIGHVDAAISELRRKSSTPTLSARRAPHRTGSHPRRGQAAARAVPAGPPSPERCGSCGHFLPRTSTYVNRCADCWSPEDDFV